jgi:hypothetical protein
MDTNINNGNRYINGSHESYHAQPHKGGPNRDLLERRNRKHERRRDRRQRKEAKAMTTAMRTKVFNSALGKRASDRPVKKLSSELSKIFYGLSVQGPFLSAGHPLLRAPEMSIIKAGDFAPQVNLLGSDIDILNTLAFIPVINQDKISSLLTQDYVRRVHEIPGTERYLGDTSLDFLCEHFWCFLASLKAEGRRENRLPQLGRDGCLGQALAYFGFKMSNTRSSS